MSLTSVILLSSSFRSVSYLVLFSDDLSMLPWTTDISSKVHVSAPYVKAVAIIFIVKRVYIFLSFGKLLH